MPKNDSSRVTFRASKHYTRVLMQQGRVQLDSDWNEQADIAGHRVETECLDVIGPSGGPLHDAGFHIVADPAQLNAEERKRPENAVKPDGFALPDFLIGAGRFYVDGILCINEKLTSYKSQPDFPGAPAIADAGLYIAYLDVWQRHMTALDDPSIREVALGGPDTATRLKTIWQVRLFQPKEGRGSCLTKFESFDAALAPPNGRMTAKTEPPKASSNPCIVPPGAGYRGLENQHYRIEVHDGGEPAKAPTFPVTRAGTAANQVQFTSGTWEARRLVEFVSTRRGGGEAKLAQITAADARSRTLTLNIDISSLDLNDVQLRPAGATYKWSRDNGSIVTSIENIKDNEVTVHDLGPDAVLGFNVGQWVEISDDTDELNGRPGLLAQITKIDPALRVVTLTIAPPPLVVRAGIPDLSAHPKMRLWHDVGLIKSDADRPIENGILVRFSAGTYRTGDYWSFPARTATADAQSGNIEWPADDAGAPRALLPFGITHHSARLAMLIWDGKQFSTIEDCRKIFAPLTELARFEYVSGDGQEAMPNDPLPQLLQVGVFNGSWPGAWPVVGANVRFTAEGNGRLAADKAGLPASATNTIVVQTGADGVASCAWRLEPNRGKPSQQVEARLLDGDMNPVPTIVRFNGNLSIAEQVFYDPGKCASMAGQGTVQKALDQITRLISLYPVSGDDQEVMPGAALEQLVVLAANRCGPVPNQKVSFKIAQGSGTVSAGEVVTDGAGLARVNWTLDPNTPRQQVEAALVDPAPPSIAAPTTVRFVANLSTAAQVAYDPKNCPTMRTRTNVQSAIDQLTGLVSLYEVSGNNQDVLVGANPLPLVVLAANRCGPVKGQKVRFTPSGSDTANPAETLTDDKGLATTTWTLGPARGGRHQLDAALVDENAPSITAPTSVQFVANIARTVVEDPGIKINGVLAGDGKDLQNDTLVPISRLEGGIRIALSEPPVATSVGPSPDPVKFPESTSPKPTAYVTLDLPFPVGTDSQFWQTSPIGFQPVVLMATVKIEGSFIVWRMSDSAFRWLSNIAFKQMSNFSDRLLARLTLKGNYIWADKAPNQRFLDGEGFGTQSSAGRTDISFISGDTRRGGDFEMWFWITLPALPPPPPPPPIPTLDFTVDARTIRGSIRMLDALMPGTTVTLSPSTPTAGPRTVVTDANGGFQFLNVTPGTYTLQVDVGGQSVKKTVTVA